MLTVTPLPFQPDFHDPPSAAVTEIFAQAEQAGAKFTDVDSEDRVPALISTTSAVAWSILRAAQAIPPRGRRLIEWGSGMGAVTLAAAEMGWQAKGLELEPTLVAASEKLAATLGRPGSFVQGSYLPGADCAIDPCDADVVFAFAWPVEVSVVKERFAMGAQPGTVLILYRGGITVEAYSATAT